MKKVIKTTFAFDGAIDGLGRKIMNITEMIKNFTQ